MLDGMVKHLHHADGITFIGYLDGHFRGKPDGARIIKSPWIGVLHNTPLTPRHIKRKHPRIHDLSSFAASLDWKNNRDMCKGLITLSQYTAEFLRGAINNSVPVLHFVHPTGRCDKKFNIDNFVSNSEKKVLSVGHWLRDYTKFFALQTSYSKVMIKPFHNVSTPSVPDDILTLEHVPDDDYDDLLSNNVVFLNLYDSGANNVIIECIERHTPILINKLPAPIEYLGTEYPLFYDTIEQAAELLTVDKMFEATRYLEQLPIHDELTINYFLRSIVNTRWYRSL